MLDQSRDLFDYAAAQAQRDRGMARAAIAQELNSPGFAEAYYGCIVEIAKRQELFFVDDVTAICSVEPSHPNAKGAPWQRAIKNGIIERSGRLIQSTRKSANAHCYPEYRSKIYTPT